MTIEDQIRDEKLQYDINREAAKISTLSSGKIDKYEYLTGEETLPSNQRQITEQAKFTYLLLGKAFEKQTKTIEDQGQKQIKAIQDKRPIKSIKNFTYDVNDSPIVLKEKEICNNLTEESFEKISNLDKRVDIDKLVFKYKCNTADEDFCVFDDVFELIIKIRDGEISSNEAKNEQKKLKSSIGEIKKVRKNIYQKRAANQGQILKIFTMQEKQLLIFFDEYTLKASEGRRQAK